MRKCENWLTSYLNLTDDQESPETFWFWSGVSTIASTTGRNVVLDLNQDQRFQFFRIYPNHYIFLIAKSAVCRKGAPTNMVRTMLTKSGTAKVMSQRITNAALLTSLKNVSEKLGKGEMLCWASELAVFLTSEEAHRGITTTLTDLYDCPDIFINELKAETEIITFPCLNLFAATNPTDMAERFPEAAFGKGFASRIHMIYEEKRRKKVSRPKISDVEAEKLIEDLRHIKQIKGVFRLSSDAEKWYDRWYNSIEFPGDEALDAFYGRKHIHVLKLAMIISLATKDELVLTPTDLIQALLFVEKVEGCLPRMHQQTATSEFSHLADRVYRQIQKRGGSATRKELLHDNWYCLKKEGLTEVLAQLIDAGLVQECIDGKKTIYKDISDDSIPNLGKDSSES